VHCVENNRRREMTKLLVAFCNFANAPKKTGNDVRSTVKPTAVLAQRSNSRGSRVCWPADGVNSVIIYVFCARYEQKFVVSFGWPCCVASLYTHSTFLFLIQATCPTNHSVLDVE